mmetsp:Transcript_68851/g.183394  ORF Transcript_68851/g.183394 Transcript_68851/m.183394 type:complete len:85 (+) Transcript_68851:1374-1628(+)
MLRPTQCTCNPLEAASRRSSRVRLRISPRSAATANADDVATTAGRSRRRFPTPDGVTEKDVVGTVTAASVATIETNFITAAAAV